MLLRISHNHTFEAQRATNFFTRLRGWMGRSIRPSDALLISPCAQIHCCFMKSAIDAVYIARSGEIVQIDADMKPGTFGRRVKGAHSVLELYKGGAERLGLKVGMKLELV
jgi:uncharacterized membrane protein (UPF0127 family)